MKSINVSFGESSRVAVLSLGCSTSKLHAEFYYGTTSCATNTHTIDPNNLKFSWNLGIGENELFRFPVSWGNAAGEGPWLTTMEYKGYTSSQHFKSLKRRDYRTLRLHL